MTYEVACHEAAHAVVAIAAGIHVTEATIHAKGGHAQFTGKPVDLLDHAAIPLLTAYLAGRIAQQWVNKHADVRGWAEDEKYIDIAIRAAFNWPSPERVADIRKDLDALANAQVAVHWAWIEATALALLRRKTLTHNQILQLRPAGCTTQGSK